MNDRFKFRAWDKYEKVLLYSDVSWAYYDIYLNNEDRYVVMQCTGLKDKNGKPIYEGDLLDFDTKEWGGDFNPEVITMNDIIGDWKYAGTLKDVEDFRKVIGNVHENPELIA